MPRVFGANLALVAPSRHCPEPEQLLLFEGGIDLMALRRERAAVSISVQSLNTRRAYRADWADFLRWCRLAGLGCLPATPDTVQLYLVDLAGAGRLPSTLERRAAAIAHEHRVGGYRSPVDADTREVLAGLRRRIGSAPRHAKAALAVADLGRLLGFCGGGSRGVRDRAILLLGFASGLRRSELAGLDLADVEVSADGVCVQLRRSKTDQLAFGREVGVHRGAVPGTCPVLALEAWILARGSWPGPLFSRRRSRLSGAAISGVVKRAASAAGLDPCRYGGHSLRAGLATAAAAGGASVVSIMGRTGHRSVAMVERYVRHGSVFSVDPLRGQL